MSRNIYKDVLKYLQGCHENITRLPEIFTRRARKYLQGGFEIFTRMSRNIYKNVKEVFSRMSRNILRMSRNIFKDVQKYLQGCQGNIYKDVQKYLKDVHKYILSCGNPFNCFIYNSLYSFNLPSFCSQD